MANKKKPQIFGPNRTALEETLAHLTLTNIDAARIQIARSLASMLDSLPESAILWREYRAAEKELREEGARNVDPFDELVRSLSAEIRDEKKPGKTKPRR